MWMLVCHSWQLWLILGFSSPRSSCFRQWAVNWNTGLLTLGYSVWERAGAQGLLNRCCDIPFSNFCCLDLKWMCVLKGRHLRSEGGAAPQPDLGSCPLWLLMSVSFSSSQIRGMLHDLSWPLWGWSKLMQVKIQTAETYANMLDITFMMSLPYF